ncbi:MAG TPA: TVP38/TMEM64 family protein [Pirellulales bacterium]
MTATDSESNAIATPAARSRWRLIAKIVFGVAVVGVATWLGRDFAHHLQDIEDWIARQGAWGYVAFILAVVVCTSIFVPDTLFAVIAGALFGLFWGTVLVVAGSLLAATLDFVLGRLIFQQAVLGWLARNPRFAAIERAVHREGFRFQFLLRLTPINPVTISYILGATKTRYPTFILACLGMIPSLFVEVYFGYVAKHVAKISGQTSEHSRLHSAFTIAGLVLCVALLVYVVRLARKALAESENVEAAVA